MLGYGSIYNHSNHNNAEWVWHDDTLIISAIKHINKGDEIFVSYGDKYWNARPDKYIDP